jgi:hypothetical protein
MIVVIIPSSISDIGPELFDFFANLEQRIDYYRGYGDGDYKKYDQ